jgi:signal transduction histidine kinase
VARRLAAETAGDPLVELRVQNQELLRSLDDLRAQQEEAMRLNEELDRTNKGVVALYAELDRRAVELQALNATLEQRVATAIAERERAEESLRQSQKMEAVGQLTGGIAHDFNNLLAGIVGSLDLMQTRIAQGRTETIERYVKAAMNSAQRAAALTHRLLAFSRRQPLDPKPVNANQLLASMEDLLRRTIGPPARVRTRHGRRLVDDAVRPQPAGERHPEPRDQRAGRHAGGGQAHNRDGQRAPWTMHMWRRAAT